MKFRKVVAAGALAALAVGFSPSSATAQDASPSAYAFGGQLQITDQDVIPPTPEATVENPGDADVSETVIDIPAAPVAVSGTLKADAKSHTTDDVQSALAVNSQELAPKYHASGVGTVENADSSVRCRFEGGWRSRGPRLLELDSACEDGNARAVQLAFPDGDETLGLHPTVLSVGGETGWDHRDWPWAFRKCSMRESCLPF